MLATVHVQAQRLMDQVLERLNRTGAKLCGVQPCTCGFCGELRCLGDMARKYNEDKLDEIDEKGSA